MGEEGGGKRDPCHRPSEVPLPSSSAEGGFACARSLHCDGTSMEEGGGRGRSRLLSLLPPLFSSCSSALSSSRCCRRWSEGGGGGRGELWRLGSPSLSTTIPVPFPSTSSSSSSSLLQRSVFPPPLFSSSVRPRRKKKGRGTDGGREKRSRAG